MTFSPSLAATVDLGLAALSAFRRQWVPARHEQTARILYSGASGLLTAASATEPYTGVPSDDSARSEALINAGIGVGAGLATYAAWGLIGRTNDWVDSTLRGWGVKHPALVTGAVSLGVTTVGHIVLLAAQRTFDWSAYADEDFSFGVEQRFSLPVHVRTAVEELLADEHAADPQAAATLRAQLAVADFWAAPDGLDVPADVEDWSVTEIRVDVPAKAARVVPAVQTYPVRGHIVAPDGTDLFLSIVTIDGRISSIFLNEDAAEYPDIAAEALESERWNEEMRSGSTEIWDDEDDEVETDEEAAEAYEALFVLRNWPRVGEFEIVADADRVSAV